MEERTKGLSGNQLKLIALISMTIDHVGYILLPQIVALRAIGRLAFPIYAYMIAEGCRYTRSIRKYLCALLTTAAVCQVVYFFTMRSLYLCIMVTFSFSVGLIWLIKLAEEKETALTRIAVAVGVLLAFFAAELLPQLLTGTDYGIDYGFLGIILPVAVYLCTEQKQKLLCMTLVLILMTWGTASVQWYALLAIPLLALYGGHRGKYKLKWLFYLYYPLHLALIWFLSVIL